MRWPIKFVPDTRPQGGSLRYRIRFAWKPITTTGMFGEHGWPAEKIWLEKVMEVQYYTRGRTGGDWWHSLWYPLNEFTMALHEHNNQ